MSALILSTLRDQRLEVADAIERLERQVDQHRADLAHLEATMRLFDPNVEPETFQPTHRKAQRLVSSRRISSAQA